MRAVGLLCSLGLFASGALVSCGNECDGANDCAPGQVCFLGSCTDSPGNPCSVDADCGGPNSALQCIAGQCELEDVLAVPPDLGMPDTGTPDTGMTDSGMGDTGTSTSPDAGAGGT